MVSSCRVVPSVTPQRPRWLTNDQLLLLDQNASALTPQAKVKFKAKPCTAHNSPDRGNQIGITMEFHVTGVTFPDV